MPRVSLADALSLPNKQRDQQREELTAFRPRMKAVAEFESDVDWLNDAVKEREQELARLREEKDQLETALRTVENSKGWRLLNACRKVRDTLLRRSWQSD
jgi:chromosome segregation ATPase